MDSTIQSINDLKLRDSNREDALKVDGQTKIGDLPIEILYRILEDFDMPTLLTCRLVSLILKSKISHFVDIKFLN